jgi:DtxR family Mn-dependent transcriptional regulator
MVKPSQRTPQARSVDLYLHAILLLSDHGQQADTGDVAARVGVSAPAASRMLRNLARKKLVRLEPYQGTELTPEGLHRALRVVRRHRLLEVFLHEMMGFDLRESHRRALLIQPAIDEVFEEKLDAMLGSPRIDPHGQPIPTKEVTWPRLGDALLLDLPAGTAGRVSRVTSEDADAIKYLENHGVTPGVPIVLKSVAPFDGPVTVQVGRRVLHLGRRLAHFVHVERAPAKERPSREKKPSEPKAKPSNDRLSKEDNQTAIE